MRKIVSATVLTLALYAFPAIAEDAPAAGPAARAADVTPVPGNSSEPDLKNPGKNSYVIKDAPLPNDFVMGKKTAPIVIIEYASLSCPHCAHFSNAVLPDLQKQYIETGKVKYVLRQFPLNEPALKGAMLVECVGEKDQSKYFLFSKVLFDAQNKWAFDGNYLSGLETIANVGGMNKEQFQQCVTSTDRETQVLKEKKLADTELKIPHTPYIFIDGEVYNGPHTIEDVGKFIDERLTLKSAEKKQ